MKFISKLKLLPRLTLVIILFRKEVYRPCLSRENTPSPELGCGSILRENNQDAVGRWFRFICSLTISFPWGLTSAPASYPHTHPTLFVG